MKSAHWMVGQTVIINGRLGRALGTIERVGKLHFTIANMDIKFRVRDGYEVSPRDAWHPRLYVSLPKDDGEIQAVKEEVARRRLESLVCSRAEWVKRNISALSVEKLHAIADAMIGDVR